MPVSGWLTRLDSTPPQAYAIPRSGARLATDRQHQRPISVGRPGRDARTYDNGLEKSPRHGPNLLRHSGAILSPERRTPNPSYGGPERTDGATALLLQATMNAYLVWQQFDAQLGRYGKEPPDKRPERPEMYALWCSRLRYV